MFSFLAQWLAYSIGAALCVLAFAITIGVISFIAVFIIAVVKAIADAISNKNNNKKGNGW